MKTAKEILLKHLPFASELWLNVNKEIFAAMEEYAEQFGGQFEQQVSLGASQPVLLAEDCVEIHLNYSTDGTLRIFGWTPYGEREELDILMGEIVTAHNDHYEVDKSALFRILAKLLQNGQKYIISGG